MVTRKSTITHVACTMFLLGSTVLKRRGCFMYLWWLVGQITKGFVFSLLKHIWTFFYNKLHMLFGKLKRFPLQRKLKGPTQNSVSPPPWVTQAPLPATGREAMPGKAQGQHSSLQQAVRGLTELKRNISGGRGARLSSRIRVPGPGSYSLRVARGVELGPPGWATRVP